MCRIKRADLDNCRWGLWIRNRGPRRTRVRIKNCIGHGAIRVGTSIAMAQGKTWLRYCTLSASGAEHGTNTIWNFCVCTRTSFLPNGDAPPSTANTSYSSSSSSSSAKPGSESGAKGVGCNARAGLSSDGIGPSLPSTFAATKRVMRGGVQVVGSTSLPLYMPRLRVPIMPSSTQASRSRLLLVRPGEAAFGAVERSSDGTIGDVGRPTKCSVDRMLAFVPAAAPTRRNGFASARRSSACRLISAPSISASRCASPTNRGRPSATLRWVARCLFFPPRRFLPP